MICYLSKSWQGYVLEQQKVNVILVPNSKREEAARLAAKFISEVALYEKNIGN